MLSSDRRLYFLLDISPEHPSLKLLRGGVIARTLRTKVCWWFRLENYDYYGVSSYLPAVGDPFRKEREETAKNMLELQQPQRHSPLMRRETVSGYRKAVTIQRKLGG